MVVRTDASRSFHSSSTHAHFPSRSSGLGQTNGIVVCKDSLLMLGPYKEIKPQIYTTSVTWATYLHCTSLSCLWARQRSAQQKLYTTEPAQFILIAASLTCCQTSIILILIFHRLRNNREGKFTPVPSDFIDQAQCTLRDSGDTCRKHIAQFIVQCKC